MQFVNVDVNLDADTFCLLGDCYTDPKVNWGIGVLFITSVNGNVFNAIVPLFTFELD